MHVTHSPLPLRASGHGAGGSTWALSPTYDTNSNGSVGRWTNDPSCANGTTTSPGSETRWLAQSIVDQSSITGLGATPNFYYPNTAMSAWLCRSVQNSGAANNSSPQGQIFYANIGQGNSPPSYAVDSCTGAEGVNGGNVPGFNPAIFGGAVQGSQAITYDMIGHTNLNPPYTIPAQCVRRSH